MKYAIKDGNLMLEEQAVIPITNKSHFFGYSVYESIKVLKGRILFVSEHLERLFNSAKLLNIISPLNKKEIKDAMQLLVQENKINNALLRIQLLGGDEVTKPQLFIFSVGLTFYHSKYYTKGIKVITYQGERFIPLVKSNCLLLNYLAYTKASKENALDALLINKGGEVLEGTRTNFFAIKNGILITSNQEVLQGVTRKHILEIAKTKRIPISFEKIKLKDVLKGKYDELFITNTSMGAMPITHIDNILVKKKFSFTKIFNDELKKLREI